jgi:hypothetical protein
LSGVATRSLKPEALGLRRLDAALTRLWCDQNMLKRLLSGANREFPI